MIRIFVYGTLRSGGPRDLSHPRDPYNVHYIGKARTFGTLYDLFAFPAAIFVDEKDTYSTIIGEVLESGNDTLLDYLDLIEGCNMNKPKQSLFYRKWIKVRMEDTNEIIHCWAYEFNHPNLLDGAEFIEGGDYNAR